MITVRNYINKLCERVSLARPYIEEIKDKKRDKILLDVANRLRRNAKSIIKANNYDIEYSKEKNISASRLDRILLNESRIKAMANSVEEVASLPCPVGKVTYSAKRQNGLHIKRVNVPLGLIGVIYESRPNVTSDVAALSFKSGNVAILRCGSESFHSAKKILDYFHYAFKKAKIPVEAITLIDNKDRDSIKWMVKANEYIDVIIPRGGNELMKMINKESTIPVLNHLSGNCHTYIHKDADLQKAKKIVVNAKMRRVSICGATESLVVDREIAHKILPDLVDILYKDGCEVRGDEESVKIDKRIKEASEEDFGLEYLDKKISVKIVADINEAIKHIEKYSSSHTESIITENKEHAKLFTSRINSAIVMINTSTQFADGGEFGLGAEVGIATGKLHARGPVGAEQLVTDKYIVESNCGIRAI